ncbi:competence type IV pilus minor pilin ComGF [Bacillus tuaregi]|uniref:competence type IV pilus minor pilin ComGF n=1 Tax=Bacillus tuaregi TaxID=1816695 RepID=UPI0008F8CCA1|nr:competence type IV pilus minor pilin ComGF [Bacillus tuaregi]
MKQLRSQGFTFLEMLIAFSTFLIIVSLFPLFFQMLLQNGFVEERLQRMEWEVFAAQVKKEVRMCDSLTVENNRLILKINNESIMYESYGTDIRRRVDLKGHEVMLQNMNKVVFDKVKKGVRISVEDQFKQMESVIIRAIVDEDGLYGP